MCWYWIMRNINEIESDAFPYDYYCKFESWQICEEGSPLKRVAYIHVHVVICTFWPLCVRAQVLRVLNFNFMRFYAVLGYLMIRSYYRFRSMWNRMRFNSSPLHRTYIEIFCDEWDVDRTCGIHILCIQYFITDTIWLTPSDIDWPAFFYQPNTRQMLFKF